MSECQHLYSVSWIDQEATLFEACSSCGVILKPAGHVIVPATAVPDANVLEAIATLAETSRPYELNAHEVYQAWIDRLEDQDAK